MPLPAVASLKRLTNDVATPKTVNIIKKIGLERLSFLSIKLPNSIHKIMGVIIDIPI